MIVSTGFAKIMDERQATGRSLSDLHQQAPKIEARNIEFWYGRTKVLHTINRAIPSRRGPPLFGPSGCGISSFLRLPPSLTPLIDGTRHAGSLLLDGMDLYGRNVDVVNLRKRVGMVFQKSNPFPKSIFENVVYGPRVAGLRDKRHLQEIAERCLRGAALWDEVKDRLHDSAVGLSGGQQQRLCIARALATNPEVLLMDEPASALDPASTARIEDLIFELKDNYTIVIVTHNMQQAARISDQTAFFYQGQLVEAGPTDGMFTRPAKKHTEDYITGRFG